MTSKTLKEAVTIADAYDTFKGRTTFEQRLLHTHTELSEVALAVQHGETLARCEEEFADVLGSMFSAAKEIGLEPDGIILTFIAKAGRDLPKRMKVK